MKQETIKVGASEAKADVVLAASFEPAQEFAQKRPASHRPAAPQPVGLKPLVPFRRRAPLDVQRSDRDDA